MSTTAKPETEPTTTAATPAAAPAPEGAAASTTATSAPASAPAPAAGGATFQSASLYVGDLHPDITEGTLFEMFSRVGPVASIRVCRDAVTRRSLGYAYVNFHDVQDAERALDTMQYTDIKGRAIRIMWSQRDPALRKSGVGNIFIKNLPKSVDHKYLHDIFSMFGNILSCKVAVNDAGESKGYGYVHFETAEGAQDACSKLEQIDDEMITITPFVRVNDRSGEPEWTNLYVKQFPLTFEEKDITAIFEPYGALASVYIATDPETGKSLGFGFVNYENHPDAEKAFEELNGKTMDDPSAEGETFDLYVSKGQKKAERTREIKTKVDALHQEKIAKFNGMNLFVKNLDDSIDDTFLKETFAPYGTITSAKIVRDEALPGTPSKGHGFVCYSSAEEANRAVAELNGRLIRSKPITVTLHQRKEQRRAHLAATYAPRNMRFQGGMPGGPGMPYGNMPYGAMQGNFGGRGPGGPHPGYPGFQGGGFPPRGMGGPRGMNGPGFMPPGPFGGQPNMMQGGPGQFNRPGGMGRNMGPMQGQGGRGGPMNRGPGGQGGRGPGGPQGPMGQGRPMGMQQGSMPRGMPGPRGYPGQGPMGGPQMMGRPGMMPGQPPMGMMPPQGGPVPGDDGAPFDHAALINASPEQQKNMIGEQLYPLIHRQEGAKAGKITGMLLEMDNAELLNLIESPKDLHGKIQEALDVLQKSESETNMAE